MTRYRHLITDDNRKWWTLGAMCFALFMVMLDNTVVNVALPSIQRDLHAQISALEWVINGYTLTFAVLIATGGGVVTVPGNRPVLAQNCACVLIERPLTELPAAGRPVTMKKGVDALYRERKPLYDAWSEKTYQNRDVLETARSIAEDYA
jgi:hypothetical protein